MLGSLFEVNDARYGVLGGGDSSTRIRRAHFHPLLQRLHFCGRYGAFGRHLEILIFIADGFDEMALVGIARDKGRAVVAAFENGFK